MIRKITTGVLLLFSITVSNYIIAGTEGLCIPKFNGFYAGGSVGGAFNSANELVTQNSLLFFPFGAFGSNSHILDSNQDLNIKQSALIGQLYAGLGKTWHMFYLGGEIFGNISNYKMQANFYDNNRYSLLSADGLQAISIENQNFFTSEIKVSPLQWGADLRPGFLASEDLLIYGRVGVSRAKISIMDRADVVAPYSYMFPAPSPSGQFLASTSLNASSTKNVAALRLGGGLEYSMNPHWSIRMDYIYVYYGKLTTSGNVSEDIPSDPPFIPGESGYFGPGTLTLSYTNNVRTVQTNTVMLGISYYPQIF